MNSAKLTKRTFQMTFSALFAASLMACGGGGGSSGANSAQLNGVAAYGSPLSSANITITDSTGRQATGITGIDGSYTIDVTGFTAPLLIKASGNTGDAVREYYALASTTPKAGETATANITPLTHALVAMVSSDGTSPNEFADTAKLKNLDTSTITSALGNLQTSLKDVLINAQLPEKFDPVTTPFKADRSTAADVLLDTIKVSISDQGVALTNARVPASEDSATTPPML